MGCEHVDAFMLQDGTFFGQVDSFLTCMWQVLISFEGVQTNNFVCCVWGRGASTGPGVVMAQAKVLTCLEVLLGLFHC